MSPTKKSVNSYDVAQDHGTVWIHSLNGGGDRRGTKQAWWAVVAPKGTKFTPDKNEKLHLKSADRYHVFETFDDAAKWCKKHYGVKGFERDKFGGYHPSETKHDTPCGRRMSKDEGRWTSFSVCDRLSVDGGECKLHRSIDLRIETKRAVEAEAKHTQQENSDAGKRIAEDAVAALAEESITSSVRGRLAGYEYVYTGEVIIHAEDMLRLTREIKHFREMLGR
jgi:hypothetical protein